MKKSRILILFVFRAVAVRFSVKMLSHNVASPHLELAYKKKCMQLVLDVILNIFWVYQNFQAR